MPRGRPPKEELLLGKPVYEMEHQIEKALDTYGKDTGGWPFSEAKALSDLLHTLERPEIGRVIEKARHAFDNRGWWERYSPKDPEEKDAA